MRGAAAGRPARRPGREFTKGGLVKGGQATYVLLLNYDCQTPLCELPTRASRRAGGAPPRDDTCSI